MLWGECSMFEMFWMRKEFVFLELVFLKAFKYLFKIKR